MWKIAAIIVLGLITGVLLFAATRPDTFRVQRSATINATPEKLFAYINDLHQWSAWSPYEALDPQMKRTFSGAAVGPGSAFDWEGNSKAGAGRMEITESSAPHRVAIRLDLAKPFEAHNQVEFTLIGKGGQTDVTWAMTGPNPYFGKIMEVFGMMDRLLGKEFETGLANLKAVAER
jgi:uncharacterized protein YndB with AHSA1/START domain